MVDLVLRGGTVIDGTGAPGFRADVGIIGDRIAFVSRTGAPDGARSIDVAGRVVAPGIIDIHSHSDFTLLEDRAATTIVRQGVTTEVIGNCGQTYAPLTERNRAAVASRSRGWQPSVEATWSSVGEYLDLVRRGNGVNSYFLVGHGTLRAAAGPDDRPATQAEVAAMRSLLDEALGAGARGMSTGLEFMPGRAADVDELSSLAEVVSRDGGLVASHIRNRDRRFEEAVDEMLEVSRRGEVPLQLSHLMVKPGHRPGAWERVVERIDEAAARGQDVAADMIPYDTGPGLATAFLPSWALEGGAEATLARLRTPELRAKIRGDYDRYWLFVAAGDWDRLTLSFSRSHPEWIGERFDVLAERTGREPIDALLRVLEDEGEGMDRVTVNGRLFSEEHVLACLVHPRFVLSSDGWRGIRDGGPGEVANHPSCWGWVPRILGHYVREERALTLEEAIRKMTSFPAERLRLRDRGRIAEGLVADLVVFDPAAVGTAATFLRPAAAPAGISHVLVNGTPVVEDGKPTGALPGRVL